MSDSEEECAQQRCQSDDDAPLFEGSVGAFPPQNPVSSLFAPPRYISCVGGTWLYFAVLDKAVVGGRSRRGGVAVEKLCVFLLPGAPDFFARQKYGRNHKVSVQLFWLADNGAVRRVRLQVLRQLAADRGLWSAWDS